jgi:hypothetical protein
MDFVALLSAQSADLAVEVLAACRHSRVADFAWSAAWKIDPVTG